MQDLEKIKKLSEELRYTNQHYQNLIEWIILMCDAQKESYRGLSINGFICPTQVDTLCSGADVVSQIVSLFKTK